MVNIGAVIGVAKNVGTKVGAGVAKAVTSRAAKELSLSAAVGAVGVLGSKGCEKMIAKSEKMAENSKIRKEEKHLKAREKNIETWAGMSCEDLI